jgi:hypothetical protein
LNRFLAVEEEVDEGPSCAEGELSRGWEERERGGARIGKRLSVETRRKEEEEESVET